MDDQMRVLGSFACEWALLSCLDHVYVVMIFWRLLRGMI